jgi:hypothetical protein
MTDRDATAPAVVRVTPAAGAAGRRRVWVDTAPVVGVPEEADGTAILLLAGGHVARRAESIGAVVGRLGPSWEP